MRMSIFDRGSFSLSLIPKYSTMKASVRELGYNRPMYQPDRKKAYIFGGHGSQEPAMGTFLINVSEGARITLNNISERVGYSVVDLIKDRKSPVFGDRKKGIAPDPEKAGVAIYAVQKATLAAIKEADVRDPDLVMGHSLGQYPAMEFSGVGEFLDFVIRRGIKMSEVQQIFKAQVALIKGVDKLTVASVISEVKRKLGIDSDQPSIEETVRNTPDLSLAVIPNDPKQEQEFMSQIEDRGGKIEPYNTPASHYSGLTWLQNELQPWIPNLSDPKIPVLSDIMGSVVTRASELRTAIERHVVTGFDWSLGIRQAVEIGTRDFVIIGPSRVQATLFEKAAPSDQIVQLHSTGTPEGLLRYITAFGNPNSDVAKALVAL